MNIIKKGSARIATVAPFFFTEEAIEKTPVPYVVPEAIVAGELAALMEEPKPPEPVEVEPPPPIDVEQIEKDAFASGYTEGRKEGWQEGQTAAEEAANARIEEMTGRYAEALAEVATFKDALRAQVEEEVVRLALSVAKKIVHREIQIDPAIIHTLVRVTLERVSGKSAVTVRLSPVDYNYMIGNHKDMSQTEGREISFESDNSLAQGDFMIQTAAGDIDARIEEEFNEVENSFFEG